MNPNTLSRRNFLHLSAATAAGLILPASASGQGQASSGRKTDFQIACMTLPYAQCSFQRALEGIHDAGFKYVAWGTRHRQPNGESLPVLEPEAPPSTAKEFGVRCRDTGLTPLMMFSGIYPEAKNALEVLTNRIRQAAAARIPQVLTFGHTEGGSRPIWIERFRKLGPIARDHGVLLVIKQHGGDTGTGAACADVVREVADEGVKVNYDAGNVMDYLNLDPITDIQSCAEEIRSFCIKDHRNFPKDQDCGPGFGEIDHYKLLQPVAFTGLTMPLCCENIFAPLVERPTDASEIDTLARRAREFLEIVIRGLHT
ncbi:MAG: TIM barrel protein [Verrucomicrobia bacterium]|nr:TIM barrel protein [Verrucomicrobiota bacterium]